MLVILLSLRLNERTVQIGQFDAVRFWICFDVLQLMNHRRIAIRVWKKYTPHHYNRHYQIGHFFCDICACACVCAYRDSKHFCILPTLIFILINHWIFPIQNIGIKNQKPQNIAQTIVVSKAMNEQWHKQLWLQEKKRIFNYFRTPTTLTTFIDDTENSFEDFSWIIELIYGWSRKASRDYAYKYFPWLSYNHQFYFIYRF